MCTESFQVDKIVMNCIFIRENSYEKIIIKITEINADNMLKMSKSDAGS